MIGLTICPAAIGSLFDAWGTISIVSIPFGGVASLTWCSLVFLLSSLYGRCRVVFLGRRFLGENLHFDSMFTDFPCTVYVVTSLVFPLRLCVIE